MEGSTWGVNHRMVDPQSPEPPARPPLPVSIPSKSYHMLQFEKADLFLQPRTIPKSHQLQRQSSSSNKRPAHNSAQSFYPPSSRVSATTIDVPLFMGSDQEAPPPLPRRPQLPLMSNFDDTPHSPPQPERLPPPPPQMPHAPPRRLPRPRNWGAISRGGALPSPGNIHAFPSRRPLQRRPTYDPQESHNDVNLSQWPNPPQQHAPVIPSPHFSNFEGQTALSTATSHPSPADRGPSSVSDHRNTILEENRPQYNLKTHHTPPVSDKAGESDQGNQKPAISRWETQQTTAPSPEAQQSVPDQRDGSVSTTDVSSNRAGLSTPESQHTSNTSYRESENHANPSGQDHGGDDSFYWHSGRSSSDQEDQHSPGGSTTETPGHSSADHGSSIMTTSSTIRNEEQSHPARSTSLSPSATVSYGASALGFGGPSDWEYFGDYEAEEIDDEDLYTRPKPAELAGGTNNDEVASEAKETKLSQTTTETTPPPTTTKSQGVGVKDLKAGGSLEESREESREKSPVADQGIEDNQPKMSFANHPARLYNSWNTEQRPVSYEQRPDLDDVIRAWSEAPFVGLKHPKSRDSQTTNREPDSPDALAEASLASTPQERMLGIDLILKDAPEMPKLPDAIDPSSPSFDRFKFEGRRISGQLSNGSSEARQEDTKASPRSPRRHSEDGSNYSINSPSSPNSPPGDKPRRNSSYSSANHGKLPPLHEARQPDIAEEPAVVTEKATNDYTEPSSTTPAPASTQTSAEQQHPQDVVKASSTDRIKSPADQREPASLDDPSLPEEGAPTTPERISVGVSEEDSQILSGRWSHQPSVAPSNAGNFLSVNSDTVSANLKAESDGVRTSESYESPATPATSSILREYAGSAQDASSQLGDSTEHDQSGDSERFEEVDPQIPDHSKANKLEEIVDNRQVSTEHSTDSFSPFYKEQKSSQEETEASGQPVKPNESSPIVIEKVVETIVDPYSDLDPWGKASLNRFAAMLREEARAESNKDKLNIFNVFTNRESRLRVILYGTDDELILPEKEKLAHSTMSPEPKRSDSQTSKKGGFVRQAIDRANTISLERTLKALPALPQNRDSVVVPSSTLTPIVTKSDTGASSDEKSAENDSVEISRVRTPSPSDEIQYSPGGRPIIPLLPRDDQLKETEPTMENADISSSTIQQDLAKASAEGDSDVRPRPRRPPVPNDGQSEVNNYLINRRSIYRPFATQTQESLENGSNFGRESELKIDATPMPTFVAPSSKFNPSVQAKGAIKDTDVAPEVPSKTNETIKSDLRKFVQADFDPLLMILPEGEAAISESGGLRDLKEVMEAIPEDFSFIHGAVVAWDSKAKKQREDHDRQRHERQVESEKRIDLLFNDHEIGYGDISELEAEFKRSEAARKADEDRGEYQAFVDDVFNLVWTRLHYELDQLIPHYERYSKIMDATLAGADMFDPSKDGLALAPTMTQFLALHQKVEIRHQKAFEAVLERDRRLKKTEISPWYTLNNIGKVKQLEKQFEDAERKAIIDYCKQRDGRANRLMDVLDQNTLRGVGANQDYMEALMKAVRRIASGRAFESAPGGNEPSAGLEEVQKARAITALLATSSEQIVQTFHVADMLLNSADYEVHVAKAKVSKADVATLSKLKEERAKEDQKLMRDLEHRLALIREDSRRTNDEIIKLMLFLGVHNGRATEPASRGLGVHMRGGSLEVENQMVSNTGDEPLADSGHEERLRKALEEAKRRNALKGSV